MNADTIPEELRIRPQWVAWRWEERDGKRTKPPYSVRTGGLASHSNPATWSSFDAAIAFYEEDERIDGVGYVLSKDDPYTGIDIDHCRDASTGQIAPWALDIVRRLDSYTEVTPSGEGLRCFIRAALSGAGRKKGGLDSATGAIEIYDRNRYLTVTGLRLDDTPCDIGDRQFELNALLRDLFPKANTTRPRALVPDNTDDVTLIEKANQAANGAKFRALWAGDASGHGGDESARDLALCCILAYWARSDCARIDGLFRQSACFRPKWDEVHYADGRTYGAVTIERALSLAGETRLAATPHAPAAVEQSLAETLAEVDTFLRKFVAFSTPAQSVAITLWIAHTHALESAEASPYLSIRSPEPRSGKSRLLDVLELLVARAWRAITPTEAVLYRKIEADHPTLLLDEVDAIFGPKTAPQHEALRAVLNAGNRRGTRVPRCVGEGKRMEIVEFEVFGAKALAGLGRLPDTVADRSIPIIMRRRAPSEPVAKFRVRHARCESEFLREALVFHAQRLTISDAEPVIPESLGDRAADGWEPLLAIAEAAGGEWPRLARDAAVKLSGDAQTDEESLSAKLLSDIRRFFSEHECDRVYTAGLLAYLNGLDESPWGDMYGRELRAQGLARLLKDFPVKPTTVRAGSEPAKGYRREDFVDAWERYLPPL